ncbi:MAG TPA: hypothetical protein VFE86_17695 [Ilumatobacteraceae bacterium]|nr:hypothetical protein [Ilumatobacteraceae bacterium]
MTTAVFGTLLLSGVGLQTAAAADPVVPTEVMLPLFGAPLTFTITTGPGGALSDVSVDPATGATATKVGPHKVVFEVPNTDAAGDPGKVVVRSHHGGQSVSTRGGTLADVSGAGSWSGDVFGTGTATTVNFTIAAAADGSPDITGTTSSDATAVVSAVQHSTGDDEAAEMSARVTVTFTNAAGDTSRTLTIKVKVGTDEDGNTSAKVTVALGRLKGLAVDAGKAAGAHTWSGVLCDNTAATINYTVNADGTVSDVAADPASADVRVEGGKIEVRFAHHERVRIRVREDNGSITINVDERIRCDSADPTINGAPASTVGDNNDNENNNENEAPETGGHHGGHNDDNTTTTTTAVGG